MMQNRELTFKEKLYVTAAWMEAEGSFLSHHKCVEMASAQVEKAPLEILSKWWGGKVTFRRSSRLRQQDSWRWHLVGSKAAALAMTLYPLMMTAKRQLQIARAIASWRERGPDFIHRTHCPSRHPYSGDNVRIDKNGHRHCRQCKRDQRIAWETKRKAAPMLKALQGDSASS